ncbi:DUF72 domain-containing protein [Actinokineospora enzanensis]|uniref:DUF72 domain-containing protein n=1 Tax=Actinokineospora enzanensis TaxID=155975 RepID=UPI00035CED22|nr:DUF72 domain-containing protein [Actinokineospora enzanensis]
MIRIGISGWTYASWRGPVYPRGLPPRDELPFIANRVDTIEINGTFYGPRKPADYTRWRTVTPDDFVFAVKGPRAVTHTHRLRRARKPLDEFLDSGVFDLGEKLGPFLWQIPASLHYDPALIADFLQLLPRTARHALEVRHSSYTNDTFIDQLAEYGVSLVVADSPGLWPCLVSNTTDFVYIRLHGDTDLYASPYTDEALDVWADRITEWHRTRDVYVYLDNTMEAHAPHDAERLIKRLR